MSIVRFEPFHGFEGLARKMSNILGDIEKHNVSNAYAPKVDIAEDEKKLYIHAELPGIPKENVKVAIDENRILTIKGEKKREEKSEDKNYVRVERSFGSFTRSFYIPDNVNTEKVDAEYQNGILEIKLDKLEPVKPKEIEISIS